MNLRSCVSTPRLRVRAAWIILYFTAHSLLPIHTVCLGQTHPTTQNAREMLSGISSELDACLRLSRAVLLGSRDPAGPSCIAVVLSGDVKDTAPPGLIDLDGGPGTKLASLYYFDRQRIKNARDDYAWHQGRMRAFLLNEQTSNTLARHLASQLSSRAAAFAELANSWTSVPADLPPLHASDRDEWAGKCLANLDTAISVKSLDLTKRWASEFASAMFTLEDLHGWLALLIDNHLTALDFQKRCEPMFAAADAVSNTNYDILGTISQFPAGLLSLSGLTNYYEIERQAERAFYFTKDQSGDVGMDHSYTATSVWVPLSVRECFLKLGAVLSADNRKTWEQAPRTPYERTYFVNMLYRAWTSDCANQLGVALARFDKLNPHASMNDLMGVMLYRGTSFAGIEWPDRYVPQLMDVSAKLEGSDAQVMTAAHQWTNTFFNTPVTYAPTYTLRDTLISKKMDCVRATDMMAALYRNAGHPDTGHVRWCAGVLGHSIAALPIIEKGQLRTFLSDGMNPKPELDEWPSAYFRGAAYPPLLANNPQPYCVELYLRGIDGYIWAEGYIIQGPQAGTLVKSAIPYLPMREKESVQKVFEGK